MTVTNVSNTKASNKYDGKPYRKPKPYIQSVILSIFTLLLVSTPSSLWAQQKVQIVDADKINVITQNGQQIQKIIGNVHLKTKKMEMFADRAYKYPGRDLVKAFGNIQINTGHEMIWADTLIYYTDLDFAKLRSRVIIKSDSTTLFGNAVDYRFTNSVAHFIDRIRLVDPSGTLIANKGFYFRKADSAAFRGEVQLVDSLNYAEGAILFTNREREYYELHKNVFAFDKENSTKLKADYLQTDSTGRSIAIGHAWLVNFKDDTTQTDSVSADSLHAQRQDSTHAIQPDSLAGIFPSDSLTSVPDSLTTAPDSSRKKQSSQPDTTHIKAHKIISIQHRMPDDTTTTIRAYKKVRIWSPDFSAVSDSARYQSKTKVFELWVEAIIWYNQIQLSSPYIWVKLHDGNVKKLIAHPHPFVVRQDTVIQRLNQIKGDTLKAFFKEGSLHKMIVFPNSHILRYTKKEGKPDGAIELTAPKTNIYFKNGKLEKVKSLANEKLVNGYYRPDSLLTDNKKLKGFSWDPKLRPQKPKKPMQRRLPPIPEEPPFPLPKRYLEYMKQPHDTLKKADPPPIKNKR